jgi:4,5-dihydroxyphthalate decarboxylase
MPGLELTFACGLYDRMLSLYTREVRPEGIALDFIAIDSPREIFDRMAGGLEFDASEMSSSEFISRKAAGACPFVALPVFPSRTFRHGFITVNRRSGIRTPKDLEGKRIGVPLYTMTAAIWIRGHLQHDYGVDLSTIRWVQGAINKAGAHGKPSVLPALRKIPLEINDTGKSLDELLEAGEIDAIIGTSLPASIRRNPDIQRLFPDFPEVEKEYYRRTRIFPIMHLVVIRREIHDAHPFVAGSLYKAFCEAKNRALDKMRFTGALRYMLPWMTAELEEVQQLFGDDPWPYGVEANRPTLQALVEYMAEQSIIAAPVAVDDLFVPVGGTS